jgi:hypothetical protein
MTDNAAINVRDVLADAWADAKQDPVMLATALFVSAVPSIFGAYVLDDIAQIRLASVIGIVLLLVQVFTIRRALDRRGLRVVRRDPPRGYAVRTFLQGIVFSLVTLIGLLLLVVPGFIVIALCAISIPILIAEDQGPIESLSGSVSRVRPQVWRVLGLFAICALPFFALILFFAIRASVEIPPSFAELVFEEVMVWLSSVSWWFVQTSLYTRLRPAEGQLAAA